MASEKKCLLDLVELVGFINDDLIGRCSTTPSRACVPEPETLHRGVRRLESGCFA